jgi:hypothetical protein
MDQDPDIATISFFLLSTKVMDIFRRANELQAEGHHVLHCEAGMYGEDTAVQSKLVAS